MFLILGNKMRDFFPYRNNSEVLEHYATITQVKGDLS